MLVGNTGTLLGGLALMPAAAVDDGLLDVVNLAPKGLPAGSRSRRGWRPATAGAERIEHWQAREVVINPTRPAAQIDGDPSARPVSCGYGSTRARSW